MADGSRRDAARVRIPPPLVYGLIVVVGIYLDRWLGPVIDRDSIPGSVWWVLCGVSLFAGCWLAGAAFLWFRRTRQNPEPWKPTPELIVGGIYRWTRNPMYIGMAAWQMAWGFGKQNLWVVLLTPLSLLGVYLVAVRQEEGYLEEKFGQPYVEYKRSVRRWL